MTMPFLILHRKQLIPFLSLLCNDSFHSLFYYVLNKISIFYLVHKILKVKLALGGYSNSCSSVQTVEASAPQGSRWWGPHYPGRTE